MKDWLEALVTLPIARAIAMGIALVVILVWWYRRNRTVGREFDMLESAAKVAESSAALTGVPSALRVTAVHDGPSSIRDRVPFLLRELRLLPGTTGSWLAEADPELPAPSGHSTPVSHIVVSSRDPDRKIAPGVGNLPVVLSYVNDFSLLTDPAADLSKCAYYADVIVDPLP